MRVSPACSAISSVNVRKGGSSGNCPQSGFSQNGSSLAGPNAMTSARARSWATIVAPENSALPNVWSPWWWVFRSVRTGAVVTFLIAAR